MFHYLFTNDLRISSLESSLKKAGHCFATNTVPTATENKNENNNMLTLGFYFNLTHTSNCAKLCDADDIRTVVLNFIKKFQFPNPRTMESFNDAVNDSISLAPLRLILQILYFMKLQTPADAYLTREEITNFIFFNYDVAKKQTPNISELIMQITEYRKSGILPRNIESDENKRNWLHCERQVREMTKILTWSGCVSEIEDSKLIIQHDHLTTDNKADLFDIITFNEYWNYEKFNSLKDAKASYQNYMDIDDSEIQSNAIEVELSDIYSPEWFALKAKEYPTLDEDAQTLIDEFKNKFSPERLYELSGKELLTTIFLNNENPDNLCRILEFNPQYREIFGSIKGGSAYKYGLYYSSDGQWAGGTSQNQKRYTEEKAIEIGTAIRDNIVAGAKTIAEFGEINNIDDYKYLYKELKDITNGEIDKSWVLKYYQMLYPSLFAPIYSDKAQQCVLNAIGLNGEKFPFVRMAQIRFYANSCGISNIVFNRIFWDNYVAKTDEEIETASTELSELNFETKLDCDLPRNLILFGAPGTGKSHTLNKDVNNLVKNNDAEYERVTFHPDYSYANFVGTYKPVPTVDDNGNEIITYRYVPGPFIRVLTKALKNANNATEKDKPYILVIEEINRSNVAAVFGEVFQLLDRDDNNCSKYDIETSEDLKKHLAKELNCSMTAIEKLKIPNNMFIWATMNSADQGVFPMDTAFKRRWDFTYCY